MSFPIWLRNTNTARKEEEKEKASKRADKRKQNNTQNECQSVKKPKL